MSSSSSLEVRSATLGDAKAITEVHLEATRAAYRDLLTIWALQVAESHWGQGVGLALWDCAREGLLEEGCISVSVWVPLRNERALRFFELAGFKRDMATAKTVAMGTVKVEEVRLKRNLA